MQTTLRTCAPLFLIGVIGLTLFADSKPGAAPVGPLSPKEELATFKLLKGFKAELVACEPDVVDPVAIAFDEEGRMYVAEMRGYPNGGVGTGVIQSGKIKLLEDRDGDGVYEKSTTFAEGLRFPNGMMPWNKGIIASIAPDIIYFEDTDGDGKADVKRTLYTGFELDNIQQMINGLQWGMDNWVYGVAGSKGGTIRSDEKPESPPVTLRGRGIRFHPEQPGSLEPMSGGGQFGLAPDDFQHWFTCTNAQHLRQIILPDHYLRRNPYLPVNAVTFDIPDHNAACKLYRISPFEAWRVERTERRKGGSDARRFPSNELVPGGYATSSCGVIVYTADRLPKEYRGNTFICDPANNLVHRDVLVPKGSIFSAQRGDVECEFLASTDNWFRPVNLSVGPDGGIYVCDFYREAIETPLSLPDDIKKKMNLESRGRGRIWRIVPDSGSQDSKKPSLRKAPSEELVKHLADGNSWWRLTAQRLLIERQDKSAVKALEKLAREANSPTGRAHALWTLHGLKSLDDSLIDKALNDSHPGVREQALRLAEERFGASKTLLASAVKLADDPSAGVRFQAAFSLGFSDAPEAVSALARIVRKDAGDPWTQMAVLSSSARSAPGLLETLARDKEFTAGAGQAQLDLLTRLASLVGARPDDSDLAKALRLLGDDKEAGEGWQLAVLEGLGRGLQNSQRSLRKLWDEPSPALKEAVARARPFFEQAARTARDGKRSDKDRLAAVRLLGYGPFATGSSALPALLTPQNPAEIQLAAVRALSLQDHASVASILLEPWSGFSPMVRREVSEALFARPERIVLLLDAIEQQKIPAGQLDSARLDLLRKHPDKKLRERALKLLAGQATPSRLKIIDEYRPALELTPEAARGKEVFKKICATCHRLDNVGTEVGPDLLGVLRNKTKDALLIDILDPSREVDPRFINYVVTTRAGRVFTGMIAVESPSSVTLRRAEKAEDTILRNQIDEIQATAKSVMPEELEKQLSKQDVADVIAYLLSAVGAK